MGYQLNLNKKLDMKGKTMKNIITKERLIEKSISRKNGFIGTLIGIVACSILRVVFKVALK